MQSPGVGSPSQRPVEARGSWRCFGWDPFAFTKLLHVTEQAPSAAAWLALSLCVLSVFEWLCRESSLSFTPHKIICQLMNSLDLVRV